MRVVGLWWMMFGVIAALGGAFGLIASILTAEGSFSGGIVGSASGMVLTVWGWRYFRGRLSGWAVWTLAGLSVLFGLVAWLVGAALAYVLLTLSIGPPRPPSSFQVLAAIGLVFPCGALPIAAGVIGFTCRQRADENVESPDEPND